MLTLRGGAGASALLVQPIEPVLLAPIRRALAHICLALPGVCLAFAGVGYLFALVRGPAPGVRYVLALGDLLLALGKPAFADL